MMRRFKLYEDEARHMQDLRSGHSDSLDCLQRK